MNTLPPSAAVRGRHRRLRDALAGDRKWFAAALVLAAADAGGGFVLSFSNLGAAARAHGWHPWWMLPVIIDLGVPTYVIADHWLVARGHRSWFARAAAWWCAACTVVLNGAVAADASPLWRAARMAAPAMWVLGVEAVRRMWRARHHGDQPARDKSSLAEWLAAPRRTFALWRRKHALSVTWAQVRALEDARLLVADLAAAAHSAVPGTPAQPAITRVVATGRFPAHLAAAVTTTPAGEWEPLLVAWVGSQVALPDVLRAAVSAATPAPLPDPAAAAAPAGPAAAPEAPPATASAAARRPARRTSQAQARAQARAAARGMTAEQVAEWARANLPARPVPSATQLRKHLPIGSDKAKAAAAILQRGRVQAVT